MFAKAVRYQNVIIRSERKLLFPNDCLAQKAIILGAYSFYLGVRILAMAKAAARGRKFERYWAKGWGWAAGRIVCIKED
jgi:hypothetical protein